MKRYVLGVDGGGTKSHLAIFDTDGNKLDFRTWGTLNHEIMTGSFSQLEQELDALVLGVMREHGITSDALAYSVFGLAGVDTKKQHKIISDILVRLGFKDFTLCNDAYLGIYAVCPDGMGICAINGTGCTLAGKNNGKSIQIGGVGGISGDLGGGRQMGMSAVGRVYRQLFRAGKPTLMTDLLFKALDVSDKYDFLETLAEKCEDGSFNLGYCNRLLFEGAQLGDAVALELLRDIAANYAGAITFMLDELSFPEDKAAHIVLAGSVFVKGESPALIDMLKELVKERNPDRSFEYTKLEKPPVTGAVVWALNEAKIPQSLISTVYSQF